MLNFLRKAIAEAVLQTYGQTIDTSTIQINSTPDGYEGDCTVVVFPFTKFSKQAPEATANDIGEALQAIEKNILSFNVIKGFLNVVFTDSFWLNEFSKASDNKNFGQHIANGKKVMVEYSSPNTNKPLHLGHIRNNLLGFSIANILKADGYEVIKTTLINDRGVHICKSMLAWQKWGNGETPASSGMKGDHLVGKYYVVFNDEYKKEMAALINDGMTEEEAKKKAQLMQTTQQMLLDWEAGKPEVMELWKTMNGWVYEGFDVTYKKLGVDFDKKYFESNTYLLGKNIVQEGLQKNVFVQDEDKSVWIDLTADGLDRKILQRGDGTSVYITQDIGTAQMKYDDYGMDTSIYVVGNEQDYHFKVLQLIAKKMEKPYADGIYHMSYGMVELPSGKMKSREGTVVDADDIMDEMVQTAKETTEQLGKIEGFSDTEKEKLYETVGMGALKFFLLKVDPKKKMMFNPAESIDFHGFTGPFIQYTFARIKSILRKYAEQNKSNIATIDFEKMKLQKEEKELLQTALAFPQKIKEAADTFSPAVMANYVYHLAKTFNHFYANVAILKGEEERQPFRITLVKLTADVIENGMKLLGINVPERM